MNQMKRIRFYFLLFIVNHFLCGTHFFSIKRKLLSLSGYYSIGNNTKIVGPIHSFGNVSIGNNVWIGRNLSIEGNGKVEIDDNCDLAPNIEIYTGTHLIGDSNRRAGKGIIESVKIGRGVWVCGGVKILPGVTIGNGAVIGAGSIVNRDIPDNVLAVGSPIKVKKELE